MRIPTELTRHIGPAPLTGVLVHVGQQMVPGGKIYFDWVNAQGGTRVGCSPTNRIGSRFVEVTVIGATGKLLR